MAIASNALTMVEYAVMSNEPMVAAVTFSLLDNGSIMARDIPFVDNKSLIANGVRFEGNLPTVAWVALNTEGTATKGVPTPFQEQAYLLRNTIDTDHAFVEDKNAISDPRALELSAWLKSQAYDFNDKFFNNDHVTGDANSIVGLRYRLDNAARYGVRSANKINGASLDLTLATLGTANTGQANMNTLLELMDQLLWSVGSPDGTGVAIYVNEVLKRRIATGVRIMGAQGGFATVRDQYDRTVDMYKGAVIRDAGYKADQTTRVITATEASTGVAGSSTYTSMYAVHYGPESFFGWQFNPLVAKDLGLLENGVIYRTFIEWIGGLYSASLWSMARIYGLKLS